MSWGMVAVAGATLVGGVMNANATKKAANQAASAQSDSAQAGIDESRRQFDAVQQILSPYVNAGNGAVTGQQDLLGLNGGGAQQTAINGIQGSPQFGALAKQGEDAILANASATGGLRGGNVQGALAQFRPALLSQLIDQQYQRLGGLSQLGQASAAGVGSAGLNTGSQIAGLFGQQGAAQAGGALLNGRANAQMINGVAGAFGQVVGGGGGGFGAPAPYNAAAQRAAASAQSGPWSPSVGDLEFGRMPIDTSSFGNFSF